MHEALRILLVSDEALQKMLLRVSANAGSSIATLAELRSFTDSDPYEANKTITSLLIQEFVEEWDIEEDIVASRLQEVLGLC